MNERIISVINYLGLSIAEFERTCGLSNGSVSKMSDNTRRSTLDRISTAYPQININWLLTGEGEMLKTSGAYIVQNNSHGDNINGVNVSINGKPSRATAATIATAEVLPALPVIPVEIYKVPNVDVIDYIGKAPNITKKPKVPLFPDYDTLYQVYDRSMSPRFETSDMLALKAVGKDNLIIKGEPYVINTYSSGLVFRIIHDYDSEHITCKSLNDADFLPFDISKKDIANIFRIIGLIRMNV